MARFSRRIEAGFATLGRLVFHHRLKTLALMLVVIGGLVSQIPRIGFDTSTESFFRADDPAMIDYEAFRDQFGRDELLLVTVEPPEVFDAAFLEKLGRLQAALQAEVPYLADVTSLLNIRDTRGEGDRLVVEDLVKEIPRTPQAMAELRRRVLSSPLYPNFIISEDGRFTTVVIETLAYSPGKAGGDLLAGFQELAPPGTAPAAARQPLTDEENTEAVEAVERVMKRFDAPDFRLHLTGSPVVTHFLKRSMQRDMGRFILLAVVVIGLFLGALFRRFTGVFLPLLIVILSLLSTVGLMALLGVTFKLPLMVLPSFLLAVGVGASVHVLAIFYREFERSGNKERAVVETLEHSGLPIAMTSITTAAGLFSFLTAALASVADLGIFAGIGVLISLVYTLVILPALLALLPLRARARFRRARAVPWADHVLVAVADLSTRRAWTVLTVFVAVAVLAMAGLPHLRFSHNTLKWLPVSSAVRQATDLADAKLKGSVTVEMVIDTGRENGLYEPDILRRIDALAVHAEDYRNAEGVRFVGKTNSVATVVKEIHRALNEDRPDFYRIPDNRTLIAQELLLFENSGSDDLEKLVDSRFSKARLTIKVPWDDAAAYVTFVADMQAKGEELFAGKAQVTTSGLLKLFTESVYRLMRSMVESYSIAVVVITLLMILLLGSFRIGVLSMAPNLLPIVMTLGIMGWLDLPLDAFTLLVGSIALGLAVDDTIHFFHNFRRYYLSTGSAARAVHETMLGAGRAMLFTTMVLVTGFFLFMFASLNNLFNFGLLTGVTLVFALAADFMLAPAVMELVTRTRHGRGITRRWGGS